MKILLLEDDLILNEIIQEHLQEQNYEVKTTFDGEETLSLLYEYNFDLLLLDVNVPSMNGFELLEKIRQNKVTTPAIFITSLDRVDDIERGFKAGCDDYIKKPFELKELDLRINNIKRLLNLDNGNVILISTGIYLDRESLTITRDNEKFHITTKEMDVLNYLIQHQNSVIGIEELVNNLWSYDETPSDSTIRTYIKNLRKIIGETHIVNTRGVGYRFNSQ